MEAIASIAIARWLSIWAVPRQNERERDRAQHCLKGRSVSSAAEHQVFDRRSAAGRCPTSTPTAHLRSARLPRKLNRLGPARSSKIVHQGRSELIRQDQLIGHLQFLDEPPSVTLKRGAFVLLESLRADSPRLNSRNEHVVPHPSVKLPHLPGAFGKPEVDQVFSRQGDTSLLSDLADCCLPDRLTGLDATPRNKPCRCHPVDRPAKARFDQEHRPQRIKQHDSRRSSNVGHTATLRRSPGVTTALS